MLHDFQSSLNAPWPSCYLSLCACNSQKLENSSLRDPRARQRTLEAYHNWHSFPKCRTKESVYQHPMLSSWERKARFESGELNIKSFMSHLVCTSDGLVLFLVQDVPSSEMCPKVEKKRKARFGSFPTWTSSQQESWHRPLHFDVHPFSCLLVYSPRVKGAFTEFTK